MIKTLVMETDAKVPLIVLMHGDKQVSTKALARAVAVKAIVVPCKPAIADRHSGYQVGGTSPFGTRRKMPIYVESSILSLPKIYINGGAKEFLVGPGRDRLAPSYSASCSRSRSKSPSIRIKLTSRASRPAGRATPSACARNGAAANRRCAER